MKRRKRNNYEEDRFEEADCSSADIKKSRTDLNFTAIILYLYDSSNKSLKNFKDSD